MPAGTYTLLVTLPERVSVRFGAAGQHELGPGAAVYTGSAFGPGGLGRIERHRALASGEREVRHWHVDHLLGHPASRLEEAWVTPQARTECEVHRALPGREVPVGASDCTCEGHLRVIQESHKLREALGEVHEQRWES